MPDRSTPPFPPEPPGAPRAQGGRLPELSWAEILEQIGQHDDAAPDCALCDGWGWRPSDTTQGPPRFVDLRECQCVEEHIAARQRAEAFRQRVRYSHFRDEHQRKTFAAFDAGATRSLRAAYRVANEYARATPVAGWLVFYGPYGCGKTHLALAVTNELLARHIPVFYAVVPDLLDQLRASYDEKSAVSYYTLMEVLTSIDVLVLDDLGVQQDTPWAREKLYRIIANREDRALPTIVTTNQPLETLEPRVESRLYTHLYGDEVVVIDAPDYRRPERRRKVKPAV